MEDKTINCRNCGKPFTFTVSEQQFYKERGFEHEPVRCKGCRDQRKTTRGGPSSGPGPKQMHTVTCSECGQETQVPFKPTGEKPVYCRDCFNKRRSGY
ncbi:MAG TPA: zinc-ribbon domain containing protein [Candidatus Ozemobacteraceae bacterium]|nr:zinc-ribbon domain containing protein [Candidatus Ozemobacteraceae bacterium]